MRIFQGLFLQAALFVALAAPAHAFCSIIDATHPRWGDLTGAPRQMTVADEFGAVDFVLIGKVVGQRRVGVHNDGLFDATNYRVALVTQYKGKPPKTLTIYISNTSARFDMDIGKAYLLFVYHHWGRYEIDNCGWSDEIPNSNPALRELDHRAEFAKRPSHCWKGLKHACVPDLRTYRPDEKSSEPGIR